jgi:penicillin-binding protein 1A
MGKLGIMKDPEGHSPSFEHERRRRRYARGGRKSRLWLKLLALGVFLGLVVTAGASAGAMIALTRNMPSIEDFEPRRNAVNTKIYDRNGVKIAELHGAENRVVISGDKIADVMKEATIAFEDERFYDHHGIDVRGIARAMAVNVRAGGIVQGGSTITEQYVKRMYVGSERTYTRKLREAGLAWQLEDRWSKDKILTEYLNTVYYGDGAYGVEAAARTFFHKRASKLKLHEAALLAALPKFPSQYSPTNNPKEAKKRRNIVLGVMAQQGYITAEEAAAASKRKLGVKKSGPELQDEMADYFIDYVTRVLTARYGSKQVFEGGLKVYTSVDIKWQRMATKVIKETTGPLNFGFKPSAAMVAVDPKTGHIRAMVGGLDYEKQKFNLAWQARRQAGSSMKPFVLTAAVLQGMNPTTTHYSSASRISIPMGVNAKPWEVNGNGGGGQSTVSQATARSDNVVYAQLSVDVGPRNTVDVARKMGITSSLDAVPSIVLGTSVVSPLEMAVAYATLASGGIYHKPQAIVKVVLPDGTVDWKPKIKGKRVLPAGVASVVTKELERAAVAGTGSATGAFYPYPRAGKTGTTENGWDVWYVGYTPQLATAVWMGNSRRNSPMSGAYGGVYCAPMWGKFNSAALKKSRHPGFKYASWSFKPWKRSFALTSPSASPATTPKSAPQPTTTPTPSETKPAQPKPPPPPKPDPPPPPKPDPPPPPKPDPPPEDPPEAPAT